MKTLNKTWLHTKNSSTRATKIYEYAAKKFILSYENGNAYERFTISQYDGTKLNPLATLSDLGVKADTSAYHLMEERFQKERFDSTCRLAIGFIKMLNS